MDIKKDGRILCVGLACLDLLVLTKEFPAEDSDSRTLSQHLQRGGNASNSCTVLSHLGADCELVAALSDSQDTSQSVFDKFLLNDLKQHNICMDNCNYYSNHSCPFSVVLINSQNGSRTILHQPSGMPAVTYQDFQKLDLNNYKWIHFEGRCPAECSQMMQHIFEWNRRGQPGKGRIVISVECEKPTLNYKSLTPFADLLFVSKEFSRKHGFETKEKAAVGFRPDVNPSCTVVSPWGEDGVAASLPNGDLISIKAFVPSKIVDTLGAGDTFIASVIYGMTKGQDVPSSLAFGCRVASEKCATMGYGGLKNVIAGIKNEFKLDC